MTEQKQKLLLAKIVDKAIEDKDIDKLRYIGQSLDVMLFDEEHKGYFPLFMKIDSYLNNKNIDLLGRLKKRDYPDLDEIGLLECITFKS